MARKHIPAWLPQGAKDSAELLIMQISQGKYPQNLRDRLNRLICDTTDIKAMWKKLEGAAQKAVNAELKKLDEDRQKDVDSKKRVDEKLSTYLTIAIHADGYYRDYDLKRNARIEQKRKYQKITDLANNLINEIRCSYNPNEIQKDLALIIGFDRGATQELVEAAINATQIIPRYPFLHPFINTLQNIALVTEMANIAVQIKPPTLPTKRNAKKELAMHYATRLKKEVMFQFHTPLNRIIADTWVWHLMIRVYLQRKILRK